MLCKNDNRASEFAMNICDNLFYVHNNYGFIMYKFHAYRLGILSIIFGFKDRYFIACYL